MSTPDVPQVLAASSLSVLCWVDGRGQPQARGVVALVREDQPALAFTYADENVARDVARAGAVALVLAESRSTGRAFEPLMVTGPPKLVEDPTGELFTSELLTQELHRYPPARIFADSPLLMREHWWYLPRLVVDVQPEGVEPLPQLTGSPDHVLVVANGPVPVVRLVGVRLASERRLEVSLAGEPPPAGPAVVFGQDASFPDLEQWSQWKYRGSWDGEGLDVSEAPARTGLGAAPGLVQRWRRQRALERRCVAAIPRP